MFKQTERETEMNKCIHYCGKYHGCDGCWYCKCSAFDKGIESEYCNEDCIEFETDESEDE